MENALKENKMGTAPVWSLLFKMALPIVLSTAVQSMYNVVDGIFISQLGEDALAAITFANPCTTVLIAIGSGIAVGMNTMLSRGLGAKKYREVNDTAKTSIFLGILGYILVFIALLTVVRPYLSSQTNSQDILNYGIAYLSIYLGFGFCTIFQLLFERMLISTGKTHLSMIPQATGAIVNIILDPLLIFGYFGLPQLGIAGAALATVISQFLAASIALFLNFKYNNEVKISFTIKPPIYAVKRILSVGFPTMILMSLSSVMIINFNMVLNKFSSTAVAVFGACMRISGTFYAIINAFCSAAVPIIAYNHGAKNKKRINQTIIYGYIYSVGIMILGTILCVGFPEFFLRLFNATDDMIEVGVWGMRMLCCCYTLVAVKIMSATIVQALGHGFPSMAVDLTRNYLLLVPLAWLFSMTNVLNNVWLSIPIADTISALVGIVLVIHFYKKDIKPLEKAEEVPELSNGNKELVGS